jgi:uncharacterized membrane protein SpoIIM required for sporulation
MLSIFIFLSSLFLGLVGLSIHVVSEVINSSLKDNTIELNFYYFIKNNIFIILRLILGGFLFGAPTVACLIYNGLPLGYLLKTNPELTLFLVLPHGIFEIPAIIIAGAAGFKIPYEIVRYLMGKKETVLTKEDIKEYFTLALISIVLIVIAAFVEAYITPKVAEYFLSK